MFDVNRQNLRNQEGKNLLPMVALGFVVFIVALLLFLFLAAPFFGNSGNSAVFVAQGIAVIPIKGEISNSGDSVSGSTVNSSDVTDLIGQANNDSAVGAIMLDIDSPGGEVVASKQIVYAVRQSKKPVYAYINSIGASGAYYIAASTKYAMADDDSITGSIGVISEIVNVQDLMRKIGVKVTTIKEGSLKDTGSPFTALTPEQEAILQGILKQAYENFKSNVLEFREGKLSSAELDSVADGRVLTGTQAYEHHLIDGVGTKQEAIGKFAQLSGIERPNIIQYGQNSFSLFKLLFNSGKAFGSGFVSSLKADSSIQIR